MSAQFLPIASTVERIIHHTYMMYPDLNRQTAAQLIRKTLLSGHAQFKNNFNEPVCLTYEDGAWLTLADAGLRLRRVFLLPQPLANIYLHGTLDRYHYFDPTPYRIEEKPLHRCRRYTPMCQEELLNDIHTYFGWDKEIIDKALSTLFYVRKEVRYETDRFQIDFAVDDLSWPAITITRLSYGHLTGGEPRKKHTHYDLRQVIDFMRYSFKQKRSV